MTYRTTALALLLCLTLIASTLTASQPDYQQISSQGRGFVIWESSRTGAWRIWRMELDGTGLRQLSPDEADRDHFCPHISPDGKRYVYLSYPKGAHGYDPHVADKLPHMVLATTDGKHSRVLVSKARAYGEHRAAVWVDDDRLIYIDGDGYTQMLTISTGANRVLTDDSTKMPEEKRKHYGILINRQLTHGAFGWPAAFDPYDPSKKQVTYMPPLRGCQPYFTADGVWGYWMNGGGGPIARFNLKTREQGVILHARDARMPKDRSYLYFPMISHNQRLIAFAASPGQHDHFDSDYDIFIARINPTTLDIEGPPVRYTDHPACDRYPDVWITDLALGTHRGEAPYTVKLTAKGAAAGTRWNMGDGGAATGATVTYRYTKPGDYSVEAPTSEGTQYGRVIVTPATPPAVKLVTPSSSQSLLVTFTEPVDITKASFKLQSGLAITKVSLAPNDPGSVQLQLKQPLKKADRLQISGVRDRAQSPNSIKPISVALQPQTWPANTSGMVLNWRDGRNGCIGPGGARWQPEAIGAVGFDSSWALRTAGGVFRIADAETALLDACRKSNAFSIELTLKTDSLAQSGPARIVSFSTGSDQRNFTLGQEQNRLILRLRTTRTGVGSETQMDLGMLTEHKETHVVVSYRNGSLQCWINGQPQKILGAPDGDLSNWNKQHLVIGNEWDTDRTWRGAIRGLALYARALDAAEAVANYHAFRALHPAKPVPSARVKVLRLASTPAPTLEEIRPYREALVLDEYHVLDVLEGVNYGRVIRIARWAILGRQPLPDPNRGNQPRELRIEPFEKCPQLEGLYMADKLPLNPDVPMFYETL